MPAPFTYRDLEAWQRGMELVERCYRISESFPRGELFGLTAQLRRAAISIPSNLAEGHCRRTTNAYINHVSIAIGSHGELVTLLEISQRLGFVSSDQLTTIREVSDTLGRLLYGLHRALRSKAARI